MTIEDKIYELPTDTLLEKAHFILEANDLRSRIYEEEEADAFDLECEMRDVSASMAMDAEAELIKARNEGIEKALDLLYKQNLIDSKIVKTTLEALQVKTDEEVCEEKDMVVCCGCNKKVAENELSDVMEMAICQACEDETNNNMYSIYAVSEKEGTESIDFGKNKEEAERKILEYKEALKNKTFVNKTSLTHIIDFHYDDLT